MVCSWCRHDLVVLRLEGLEHLVDGMPVLVLARVNGEAQTRTACLRKERRVVAGRHVPSAPIPGPQ